MVDKAYEPIGKIGFNKNLCQKSIPLYGGEPFLKEYFENIQNKRRKGGFFRMIEYIIIFYQP